MAEKKWRFIDSEVEDAALNMAIDEAILDAHLQGLCPPTLRVYRWNPPAISLGFFQKVDKEIEQETCRELGVGVVRRLTGGRAILHDDELTYSVVTSEEYGASRSLAESYRSLNQGLIAAYDTLGLEVCLEAHPREPASAACFSSAGSADLTFQGRKICGSAQCRRGSGLLQHGSLPISVNAQSFFSMLKYPSDAIRDRARAVFGKKAVSLGEALGGAVGYEDLKNAVCNGFQKALGIELQRGSLTPREFSVSRSLASEKYGSSDWNLHGTY
jgi:lipoate-protein ligase A